MSNSKTIKAILVGNDDKSDGHLFYNPLTEKILGSSDYCLNVSCPSGPLFRLKYKEPTTYTLFNEDVLTSAPAFDIGQQIVMSPPHLHHPLKKATVLDIPFKHSDTDKVKITECNTILDALPCDLLPYDPNGQQDDTGISLAHPWCKHKARCTIFLTKSMAIPKHCIIIKDSKTGLSILDILYIRSQNPKNQ